MFKSRRAAARYDCHLCSTPHVRCYLCSRKHLCLGRFTYRDSRPNHPSRSVSLNVSSSTSAMRLVVTQRVRHTGKKVDSATFFYFLVVKGCRHSIYLVIYTPRATKVSEKNRLNRAVVHQIVAGHPIVHDQHRRKNSRPGTI